METLGFLKTTPLFNDHIALGAKMAPFAGWNMPIQYEGIIAETLHTRKQAVCFDICHMGEFLIKGDLKKSGLDNLVTARLSGLAIGSCCYSSLLNDKGGVIDDLMIYRKKYDEWMIVVNAGTIEKDKKQFLSNLSKDSDFKDISNITGKIDIQGPLSREVIMPFARTAQRIGYYTFFEADIAEERCIISRTGYTGELGFEIYASQDTTRSVWKKLLLNKNVKPAGLGARDVLRLEMGYNLYSQDMNEDTTPLEAGLEKFIDLNKDFIGKNALLRQKISAGNRSRIFFTTTSRRSPRHDHKIYFNDKEIGVVTSGSFSPHLEKGIGMGFVQAPLQTNSKISIGDDNLKIEALTCDKPFVKKTSLKN
jgi:aminomethyltransferase